MIGRRHRRALPHPQPRARATPRSTSHLGRTGARHGRSWIDRGYVDADLQDRHRPDRAAPDGGLLRAAARRWRPGCAGVDTMRSLHGAAMLEVAARTRASSTATRSTPSCSASRAASASTSCVDVTINRAAPADRRVRRRPRSARTRPACASSNAHVQRRSIGRPTSSSPPPAASRSDDTYYQSIKGNGRGAQRRTARRAPSSSPRRSPKASAAPSSSACWLRRATAPTTSWRASPAPVSSPSTSGWCSISARCARKAEVDRRELRPASPAADQSARHPRPHRRGRWRAAAPTT